MPTDALCDATCRKHAVRVVQKSDLVLSRSGYSVVILEAKPLAADNALDLEVITQVHCSDSPCARSRRDVYCTYSYRDRLTI